MLRSASTRSRTDFVRLHLFMERLWRRALSEGYAPLPADKVFCIYAITCGWDSVVTNGDGNVNKVEPRRARLALGLVDHRWRVYHPAIYPRRPTQPGHPSVGMGNEY